jgi:hypothetical protein
MAGNFRAGAGVEPAQSRTAVQGSYRLPVQQAPVQQVPAGYQLMYQMGGPRYMYGETPFYGARYGDGRTVPGQIYGNMPGSREGADMFGFFPTMFQSSPYATASQMYTPSLGVMPLIGYPSKYPHVIMGGYTDYGAPIANQAMNMMLPLLMMGLYRTMFPMPGAAPAQAAGGGGGKKGGGGSGGGATQKSTEVSYRYDTPFVGPVPPEVRYASSPAEVLSRVPGMEVRTPSGALVMNNDQYRRAVGQTIPSHSSGQTIPSHSAGSAEDAPIEEDLGDPNSAKWLWNYAKRGARRWWNQHQRAEDIPLEW